MNTTGDARPTEFTVSLEDQMDPPGTRVRTADEDATRSPGKAAAGRLCSTENHLRGED